MTSKKKILVAPLNWGLGHATRCIPIINALIKYQFEPILASDGAALQLLQKEFPALKSYELPGYQITYSASSKLHCKLALQAPSILRTYRREHAKILEIHKKEQLAGIISDNRFGAYLPKIASVYITHQLRVFSGITTFVSTKLHQYIIAKFDECWVPDNEGEKSISGELSDVMLAVPIKYIGVLSRLKRSPSKKKYDVLVLISGPEPQRSMLEKKLLNELSNTSKKIMVVRGIIDDENMIPSINENITVKNYMLSEELSQVLNASELVVSRSGYSTLMDLARLHKKAFFIPTPGQYEQFYLAKRMHALKIGPFCVQEDFKEELLGEVENYSGFETIYDVENSLLSKELFHLF